jgi:hypothetical protein
MFVWLLLQRRLLLRPVFSGHMVHSHRGQLCRNMPALHGRQLLPGWRRRFHLYFWQLLPCRSRFPNSLQPRNLVNDIGSNDGCNMRNMSSWGLLHRWKRRHDMLCGDLFYCLRRDFCFYLRHMPGRQLVHRRQRHQFLRGWVVFAGHWRDLLCDL